MAQAQGPDSCPARGAIEAFWKLLGHTQSTMSHLDHLSHRNSRRQLIVRSSVNQNGRWAKKFSGVTTHNGVDDQRGNASCQRDEKNSVEFNSVAHPRSASPVLMESPRAGRCRTAPSFTVGEHSATLQERVLAAKSSCFHCTT